MAKIGEVFDAIVSAVRAAHEKTTDDFAVELKYKVSVPIQIVRGPRGGKRIIRSKPGEPPRKETGKLQASIKAQTIAPADVVASGITADAPYAVALQERLNRPITDGEIPTLETQLLNAVADAING